MPINSVTELVRSRADSHGDKRIYTFLKNGETEAGQLNFAEVDRISRTVASTLQETTAAGERVLRVLAQPRIVHRSHLGMIGERHRE